MKQFTIATLLIALTAPGAMAARITDDTPVRLVTVSKPGAAVRVMVQPTPMTMKQCKQAIPEHAKEIAGQEFKHLICMPADLTSESTILDDLPIADVE